MSLGAAGSSGPFPLSAPAFATGFPPAGSGAAAVGPRPSGVAARGLVWGGMAGACAGTALGGAVGFVLGALVGFLLGWAVGAVLGLIGVLALASVRRRRTRTGAGPADRADLMRARCVAGTAPGLVVLVAVAGFPGGYLLGGAFAFVCIAVGGALGPVVAFGPGRRPGAGGRRYGVGVLVAGCAAGALAGLVAGLATAAPVALLGSVAGGVIPVSALAVGAWVGLALGALAGIVLAGLRACPPRP